MSYSNEEFTDAVSADVKGEATPQQKDLLEENLSEWIDELTHLLREVDLQFSARKAQTAEVRLDTFVENNTLGWLERQKADKDWKLKANRFRASIEGRLRYAKSLRVK